MAAPLLIAAGIGTALSAYGQWQAGKQRASALRHQSMLDQKKADEVELRARKNVSLLFEAEQRFVGAQEAAFAGSGRAQGATNLAIMQESANEFAREAQDKLRTAKWEAAMIRIGAEAANRSAADAELAGALGALGTLGLGAADILEAKPGRSPASKSKSGGLPTARNTDGVSPFLEP